MDLIRQDNGSLVIGNQDIAQVANVVSQQYVFTDYASRKSANTLRRHKADLQLFVRYLIAVNFFNPGILNNEELNQWIEDRAIALMSNADYWQNMSYGLVKGFRAWQISAGYAIGSINNRLSTVKVYADLATQAGIIPVEDNALIASVAGYKSNEGKNVNEKRDTTRVGKKKEESVKITLQQAEQLKNQPDTPAGRRDKVIMTLLLEHGLRVSELSSLKVSDFDRDTNTLSFYREKVKAQAIPHVLKNGSLAAMLDYLNNDAIEDSYLLRGSRKDNRLHEPGLSEQNINARVKKLGNQIGIKNLSPHDLRHFCATKLARAGRNVRDLMDFFGWSNAGTALRYIESTETVEAD